MTSFGALEGSRLKGKAEAASERLRKQDLLDSIRRKRTVLFGDFFLEDSDRLREAFYQEISSPLSVRLFVQEATKTDASQYSFEKFMEEISAETDPFAQLRGWVAGNNCFEFSTLAIDDLGCVPAFRPELDRAILSHESPEIQLEALNFLNKMTCYCAGSVDGVLDIGMVKTLEVASGSRWEFLRCLALSCLANLATVCPDLIVSHWNESGRIMTIVPGMRDREKSIACQIHSTLMASKDQQITPGLRDLLFEELMRAYQPTENVQILHSVLYGLSQGTDDVPPQLAKCPSFLTTIGFHAKEVERLATLERNITKGLILEILIRISSHDPLPTEFAAALKEALLVTLCSDLQALRAKTMRFLVRAVRDSALIPRLLIRDSKALAVILQEAREKDFQGMVSPLCILAALCHIPNQTEAMILMNLGIIDLFSERLSRKMPIEVIDSICSGCAALAKVLEESTLDPQDNVVVQAILRSGLIDRLDQIWVFHGRPDSACLEELKDICGIK